MAKKKSKTWKEERQKRAWTLYQVGCKPKDVVKTLGVSKRAVSQWVKSGQEGEVVALRDRPKRGILWCVRIEKRQRFRLVETRRRRLWILW